MTKKKKAKKKAKTKKKSTKRKTAKKKTKKPNKKFLGKIDHFYDKLSVATFTVKAPFKVGDIINIKGHTSNFFQRVESMQSYHKDIIKAKKGDEIGIRLIKRAREHDAILLSNEAEMARQNTSQLQTSIQPINIGQKAPVVVSEKPKNDLTNLFAKRRTAPPTPQKKKPESYGKVKFFKF